VTLSASASPGSAFIGWSGAGCSGTGQCVVQVSAPRAVTARFETIVASCPDITDWKGEYWVNPSLSGSPVVCRNDADLNFDWGAGSPDPLIPADNFSVQWTRTVNFSQGTYIFHMRHDDGARLFIDDLDQPILDKWSTCCVVDPSDPIALSEGNHVIRMEYFENNGSANAQLSWERLAPSVKSISTSDPDPTGAAIVHFNITFSEPITGVNITAPFSDVALTTASITGAAITSVSGSGANYVVTVKTGSGNGTIRLDVVDDDSIKNLVNLPLGGNGTFNGNFTGGETYTTIKVIPSVPVLLLPANGTLAATLRPTLDWKDSTPAAHHYQIQIATSSTFTPAVLVIDQTNILTSDFTPTFDLAPGRMYYWRARALNEINGASAWAAVRTFKTPLTQPVLDSPPSGLSLTTDRPDFDWQDVPGASQYILQVSASNTFSGLLLNVTVNTSEYAATKDLLQNKLLYWRVAAKTSAVTGPWSSPAWDFTTGNPASVPVLVSPANNLLSKDYTPLFNWNDSTAPLGTSFKQYELQVDDNADFTSPVINTATAVSEFTPPSDLASNTKFYWRVRAVNTVGLVDHFSGWSAVLSFRTVIDVPQSLTVIANGFPALRPRFDWDNATGTGTILNYTIQISTSPSFGTFLVNGTTGNSFYDMLKDLPSGTTIYWRVKVNGANGPSGWSTGQYTT
jgi:hypothetical protein